MYRITPIRLFLPFLAILGLVSGSALTYFQGFAKVDTSTFVVKNAQSGAWVNQGLLFEESESEKSDESESIGKTFYPFSLGFNAVFSFPPFVTNRGPANKPGLVNITQTKDRYLTLCTFRI